MVGYLFGKEILKRFYIAFVIILIPFFIVNGILTGSFIAEPVVWYNNSENLGIRLFTIPIEDIGYAFNMLFWVVFLNEKFKATKLFQK
jgi:lycopene cyclase domain-containing protein